MGVVRGVSQKATLVLGALCLAGCMSSPSYIPVQSRTEAPIKVRTSSYGAYNGTTHTVQRGENLYSISMAYHLNFLELAHKNNLSSPYTIHPGQVLRIGTTKHIASSEVVTRTKTVTKEPTKKTVVSTSHQSQTVVKSASNTKQTITNSSVSGAVGNNSPWQWPASGKLLAQFSHSGSSYKGIAIAGDIGESVVATASGEVVYSGAGLAGYGNLIIIRHDSRYLSAYAHNQTLLVSEGDTVRAGQQIAELGSTGTNEPKLHFEIRQNGKPVDPLLFLPNR